MEKLCAELLQAHNEQRLQQLVQNLRWRELDLLSQGQLPYNRVISDELVRTMVSQAAAEEMARRRGNAADALETMRNIRWDVFKGSCDVMAQVNSADIILDEEAQTLLCAWTGMIKATDGEGGTELSNALKHVHADHVRLIKVRDAAYEALSLYFVVSVEAVMSSRPRCQYIPTHVATAGLRGLTLR